jgi:hypothetical protein
LVRYTVGEPEQYAHPLFKGDLADALRSGSPTMEAHQAGRFRPNTGVKNNFSNSL